MPSDKAFDRKQQHRVKRNAIIREAARAFNENGFDGTSLDAVADRLGVTKKALYYYIKNKQEILKEIFLQWVGVQEWAIDRAEEEGKDGLDCLSLYADYYVSRVLETMTPMDRIIGEISSLDAATIRLIKSQRRELDKRLAGFVDRAIQEGLAAEQDSGLVIKVVNGALDWMFKWYRPTGPRSLSEEVGSLMSILFKGIEKR